MGVALAADIGGTFTDVVVETAGRRVSAKRLTTHDAPERAVLDGAQEALASAGVGFADVTVCLHGATLATNAIIERKGATTGLIATEGFRDVLDIADESRFDQYDIHIRKPAQLVPRRMRLTVPERVSAVGETLLPLDENAVREAARKLVADGAQAIAVAFLHAYADPTHERRARDLIAEVAPHVPVSLSSEVCPEIREYERTSTTVANAYVQPLMSGYLRRLEAALADRGCRAPLRLMTSGGHLASVETACRFPVRLVESGPAGGAILAAHAARERGERRVLSFDMGGTTAKICFIEDGAPLTARTFEVDRSARFMKGSGLPIRIPVIEMVEIGAGGGSIARVDAARAVAVGPESAGSEPGPACYGRGGERPTVTDADLVLGRISPEHFAGGAIALEAAGAEAALARDVGAPMGLDAAGAALAVGEIVDENMANAARVHAAERALTLEGCAMIAFGGAAPLHAARMAEKLGLRRGIVPPDAGVGSAVGFLRAPVAYELVRSLYMRLDAFDAPRIAALLDATAAEARALAAGATALEERRLAFMRYCGQGHEIAVPVEVVGAEALRAAFEAEYAAQFGRVVPGAPIEILTWSVTVTQPQAAAEPLPEPPPAAVPAPIGARKVIDAATGVATEAAIYARSDFGPGAAVDGPALIVEAATSTYVTARFSARCDAGGALVLTARDANG
jgi:N-methylhydantoinase A